MRQEQQFGRGESSRSFAEMEMWPAAGRDDLSRPASEKMEGYGLAKAEPLFFNAPV
jgi:hypothetical protein